MRGCSFTLSLALIASSAYASTSIGGYGSYGGHGYHNGYGSSYGGHRVGYRGDPSFHGGLGGYSGTIYGGLPKHHGHHGHHGYSHDTVESTHNYHGYAGANHYGSKYHPYNYGNNGFGNSQSTSHANPWFDSTENNNNSTNTDTTGWWSPYQQYRPPLIPYRPNNFHKTQYGRCDISTVTGIVGNTFGGSLQFAQVPWHAVQVRSTNLTGLGASGGACVRARINEDGKLGSNCDGIANTWEFNPLTAVDRFGEKYKF